MSLGSNKSLLVSLLIVSLSHPAFCRDAKELLNDVLVQYESADRFSCTVTTRLLTDLNEINVLGGIKFSRDRETKIYWIIAPFDRFLTPVEQSIVGDGSRFAFIEEGVVYRESKSLMDAITAATGVSHGMAFHIPSILLGGFSEFNIRHANNVEFVNHASDGESDWYVIKGNTRSGAFTMWINKKDLTIYQLRTPLVIETYGEILIHPRKMCLAR